MFYRNFLIVLFFLTGSFLSLSQKENIEITNHFYSSKIDSLIKVDSEIRSEKYRSLWKTFFKYKKDSSLNKQDSLYQKSEAFMKKWNTVDSSNINYLLKLVARFGFPSEDKVGLESHINAIVIFAHFDNDTLNKTLQPILDSALKYKTINPIDYSWIIDRHRNNFGAQPIYYGEFYCKKYNLLSDEQKKIVIQKREKIGLNSFSCN